MASKSFSPFPLQKMLLPGSPPLRWASYLKAGSTGDSPCRTKGSLPHPKPWNTILRELHLRLRHSSLLHHRFFPRRRDLCWRKSTDRVYQCFLPYIMENAFKDMLQCSVGFILAKLSSVLFQNIGIAGVSQILLNSFNKEGTTVYMAT